MKSIQVEVLKPSHFIFSADVDTITVIKRDYFRSDTTDFSYFDVLKEKFRSDKDIKYRDLSNLCVASLAEYLQNEGYFLIVKNYGDSLNQLFSGKDSLFDQAKLFRKLKVDAVVLLDYFMLGDYISHKPGNYFSLNIIDKFPEFRRSTNLESVSAKLLWTVVQKTDTAAYMVKHNDVLYYGNSVNPELFGNDSNHQQLLQNSAKFLGKDFGKKITPYWLRVERKFYRSKTTSMLQAEKYCIDGEWRKAAEIYNSETKNKKRFIAAKAKFNMALVCEMEGKIDLAIDWIIASYSAVRNSDQYHKSNCLEYVNLLAARKKEIEKLAKQVRNSANTQ